MKFFYHFFAAIFFFTQPVIAVKYSKRNRQRLMVIAQDLIDYKKSIFEDTDCIKIMQDLKDRFGFKAQVFASKNYCITWNFIQNKDLFTTYFCASTKEDLLLFLTVISSQKTDLIYIYNNLERIDLLHFDENEIQDKKDKNRKLLLGYFDKHLIQQDQK